MTCTLVFIFSGETAYGLSAGLLFIEEYVLVVFQKSLDGVPLSLHVGQLALYICRSHDCRCKDDGEIERRHLEGCKQSNLRGVA